MQRERQGLCQNSAVFIRNYFNIFSAGGGIHFFQKHVELIQHSREYGSLNRVLTVFMFGNGNIMAIYRQNRVIHLFLNSKTNIFYGYYVSNRTNEPI